MKKLFLVSLLALGACSSPSLQGMFQPNAPADPAAADPGLPPPASVTTATLDPTPAPPPPPTARTVAALDTTTAEDRAAATAPPPEPAGERSLGTTLATLGSPADPGIWIKTPLVSDLVMGRVVFQGTSINIELRPSGGAAGSGSQISLPAMRLLGAPLTGIVELSVFAN